MIVILGPTATGKTSVAVQLAYKIGGEIVSADSRQVFRQMNIGTGKDLNEYTVNGIAIPYHLIDIADPGEEYSVFRFQQDFLHAWNDIENRKKTAILCGGTGLYIESILKKYPLYPVPQNVTLRNSLANKTDEELVAMLETAKILHNKTDIEDRERILRALEIETFRMEHLETELTFPDINYCVFGISFNREEIRRRITRRLEQRLDEGMIEEVQQLLQQGIAPERLCRYGLEYRFITQYITKQIDYQQMFNLLNIAIHQFSKRQMTWFRKMEREGISIQWIDDESTPEEKATLILQNCNPQWG
jgi:tRNA dimethylallyltransferase